MNLAEMSEEEVLHEAKKQGFNPDYDGENKKTPREFLEVSFNHNKMLKERNEKLSDEINVLQAQLSKVLSFQQEMKEKAVAKAIADLKKERKTAIEEGDHARIEEIDQEISEQKVEKNQGNIILDTWLNRNPWYQTDEELAIEADIIAKQLQETGRFNGSEADYQKLLNQVENRVKKLFPDKFKNPKKENPPEVESGRPSPSSPSKKTYADLPPEAKRACDEFVADKIMTREDYLAIYEWD